MASSQQPAYCMPFAVLLPIQKQLVTSPVHSPQALRATPRTMEGPSPPQARPTLPLSPQQTATRYLLLPTAITCHKCKPMEVVTVTNSTATHRIPQLLSPHLSPVFLNTAFLLKLHSAFLRQKRGSVHCFPPASPLAKAITVLIPKPRPGRAGKGYFSHWHLSSKRRGECPRPRSLCDHSVTTGCGLV